MWQLVFKSLRNNANGDDNVAIGTYAGAFNEKVRIMFSSVMMQDLPMKVQEVFSLDPMPDTMK